MPATQQTKENTMQHEDVQKLAAQIDGILDRERRNAAATADKARNAYASAPDQVTAELWKRDAIEFSAVEKKMIEVRRYVATAFAVAMHTDTKAHDEVFGALEAAGLLIAFLESEEN